MQHSAHDHTHCARGHHHATTTAAHDHHDAITAPHEPPPTVTAASRIDWTCPMHPEIVRDAPGNCPICGMALEPRTIAAEEANPELVDMTRRFWVSAALSAPLLVIAML